MGSTPSSDGKHASSENFTSPHPPSYFASLYAKDLLSGGHIIMLGGGGEEACKEALAAYPQGLQIGGGISLSNALSFLCGRLARHRHLFRLCRWRDSRG